MAECCQACGKVGALENDGIGGRVCTSCGHTVDDAECLTTIVSAETGMRVSESGEYFSLDPHNNVGNIRCRSKRFPQDNLAPRHPMSHTVATSAKLNFAEKTTPLPLPLLLLLLLPNFLVLGPTASIPCREKMRSVCNETCKRAGMQHAGARTWDFVTAYLSARRVLAAYRELRDAAKVLRARSALGALSSHGSSQVATILPSLHFPPLPLPLSRAPSPSCFRLLVWTPKPQTLNPQP